MIENSQHSQAPVPSFLYGTAEKTDESLILAALSAGYRALDCACQPGLYHEQVVGQAVATALSPTSQGGLGLRRGQLFIQTKFTTPAGHQPGLAPYLEGDAPEVKVKKSLEMSMSKLQVDYIDSLLLHGPMPTLEETLEIWAGMESVFGSKVRQLGISNVSLEQLEAIYDRATIKPSMVQNRFWRYNHFDSAVRSFCAEEKINYQAFWVLTGNPQLLDCSLVGWFAEKVGASREDGLFNLVLSLGQDGSQVSVLNGTTNPARMRRSLEIMEKVGDLPDVLRQGFKDELDELANAVGQGTA
ncbi:Aldo-ket-red domain-containing protein [Fusarium falciforme]|uniref:Aldo-ket-red domain-containing protein n=1 Tax=Fusarium falciforme TaxID=195108 RepID=UPI0022FFF291|nr:Aldo-ket-red domain-containing protein [Fusarium falciforme]WAO96295.1 Aldo-ket-red domain-containing protein [Fusarium falciforme]